MKDSSDGVMQADSWVFFLGGIKVHVSITTQQWTVWDSNSIQIKCEREFTGQMELNQTSLCDKILCMKIIFKSSGREAIRSNPASCTLEMRRFSKTKCCGQYRQAICDADLAEAVSLMSCSAGLIGLIASDFIRWWWINNALKATIAY